MCGNILVILVGGYICIYRPGARLNDAPGQNANWRLFHTIHNIIFGKNVVRGQKYGKMIYNA